MHNRENAPLNKEYVRGYKDGVQSASVPRETCGVDFAATALEDAELLLSRSGGYFRFGKGRDGCFWVRYKWTTGLHVGSYVFGSHVELGLAIAQAGNAASLVEQGKAKAHRDVGYRSKDHPKGG